MRVSINTLTLCGVATDRHSTCHDFLRFINDRRFVHDFSASDRDVVRAGVACGTAADAISITTANITSTAPSVTSLIAIAIATATATATATVTVTATTIVVLFLRRPVVRPLKTKRGD